jgi:hypothetical protein
MIYVQVSTWCAHSGGNGCKLGDAATTIDDHTIMLCLWDSGNNRYTQNKLEQQNMFMDRLL